MCWLRAASAQVPTVSLLKAMLSVSGRPYSRHRPEEGSTKSCRRNTEQFVNTELHVAVRRDFAPTVRF